MRSRSNYWSCTPFADWMRGTPKPASETFEGWDVWREKAQKAHPIRYWIAEEAFDFIQDALHFPLDKLYDVKYYLLNRFVTKTHALTSTSLERGVWHEMDDRILFCLFDELVDYIEVEEAWSNIAWDKEARAKFNPPWYAIGWLRTRGWRSPEAGLDKLRWASQLTDADWRPDEEKHLAEPTGQALAAQELLVLYDWWKNVRPNRPDVHDASGWSDICRRSKGLFRENQTDEEREETRRALDKSYEIEAQYAKEDDEMLIRLIKVRKNMWT